MLLMGTLTSIYANSTLSGSVYSKNTNAPLGYANIVLLGTTIGTSTNSDGEFAIHNIKPGYYKVIVSYSGYLSEERQLHINGDLEVVFKLEETSYNINSVVVTGTRTERLLKDVPVLTHLIDEKQLESSGAINIQDALSISLPNINFNKSAAGVSMRFAGLEAKYTLFLIDGEKISGETNGNMDYNRLNISDIERIEIIKGAAGLLYGSNAIGGVVNIITKKPKQAFEAGLGSRYSKFNELDLDGTIGINIKGLSSKTNFYSRSTDGYDLTPESVNEMTQEPFKSKSLSQKFEYRLTDKLDLELSGKYYDRERFDSDLVPMHKKDYDYVYGLKSTYRINTKSSVSTVWHSDKYITKDVEELFNDRETSAYENTLNNARLSGTFHIHAKNRLNAGLELLNEKLYSTRIEGKEKEYSNLIFFAQDEIEIGSSLTAIAGLRTNVHSIYGFHMVPQISAMYKLSAIKFRTGYSMGYKSPTIKELYMNFSPIPVVEIIGNPDLVPESSHYYSLSAEYSKSFLNASASLYHNDIENMIQEVQSLTDSKVWGYENINSVQVNGMDLIVSARLKYGFSVNASYSYTDSEDKISGSQLLGTSKNNAGMMVQYNLNLNKIKLGVNLRANYYGEIPYEEMDDFTGEISSKLYEAHTVWNLTTTQELFSGVLITLGVNNIFNVYEFENVMNLNPGRRYFIGLRINTHKLKLNQKQL